MYVFLIQIVDKEKDLQLIEVQMPIVHGFTRYDIFSDIPLFAPLGYLDCVQGLQALPGVCQEPVGRSRALPPFDPRTCVLESVG